MGHEYLGHHMHDNTTKPTFEAMSAVRLHFDIKASKNCKDLFRNK
jgi:hypothetical protein